ncbi:hypothetical protein SPI_03870 [Niveomyces insectorum RCEF 264]|uniref:Uncharacterized protein n=1 Tax=Niveomyces insectorum RCEF 264 TaxID=1081102 RepID=A0A167WF38_9HYPO|nr:hypothetical protein SPI_03870 [Niveomyces insectorum RCEF 264]
MERAASSGCFHGAYSSKEPFALVVLDGSECFERQVFVPVKSTLGALDDDYDRTVETNGVDAAIAMVNFFRDHLRAELTQLPPAFVGTVNVVAHVFLDELHARPYFMSRAVFWKYTDLDYFRRGFSSGPVLATFINKPSNGFTAVEDAVEHVLATARNAACIRVFYAHHGGFLPQVLSRIRRSRLVNEKLAKLSHIAGTSGFRFWVHPTGEEGEPQGPQMQPMHAPYVSGSIHSSNALSRY